MQHKKITGIILNIRPHLEFDRVLSVFSYEFGRIRIIAKGVRKITSHRGACLDLFNEVQMEIEESGKLAQGKLYLREVTVTDSFKNLKANPLSFAAGCIIASFLDRIIPEHSQERSLFRLTLRTFQALNVRASRRDAKETLLTYFLKTLRILGHLPASLPKRNMRTVLWQTLQNLDPQLTLNARRTLGIFSNFESSLSS